MIGDGAQFRLARRHHAAGRLDAAEEIYGRILTNEPEHPEALHMLGLVAHQRGDHERALSLIERSLALDDRQAAAWSNRGNALVAVGNRSRALQAYRRALSISPEFAEAHNNLGRLLHMTGHSAQARRAYLRALELKPDYPDACSNLGQLWLEEREPCQALGWFERALALDAQFAEARYNRGLARLTLGRLSSGWLDYEWRLRSERMRREYGWPQWTEPRWEGERGHDRRLLVYADQGLGDTIQLARYLPEIKARVGEVVLACQAELHPLLERAAGVDRLIVKPTDEGGDNGDLGCDLHIPLMSVPGVLGTTVDTIPASVPYLGVDPERRDGWGEKITSARFRVGLVWGGGGHIPTIATARLV